MVPTCTYEVHCGDIVIALCKFFVRDGAVRFTHCCLLPSQLYWFFGIFDVVVKVICPGKKKA